MTGTFIHFPLHSYMLNFLQCALPAAPWNVFFGLFTSSIPEHVLFPCNKQCCTGQADSRSERSHHVS